jgi:Reverse transcriptase (RNA-dependent DNA polymerase)
MVYLDDILIASPDLLMHIQIVQEVLTIIQTYNLYLKPEKCDWIQKEVEYLGHIISYAQIQMGHTKTQAIDKWKISHIKKELQLFLGFTNYYHQFITGYSNIMKLLTILTGKTP